MKKSSKLIVVLFFAIATSWRLAAAEIRTTPGAAGSVKLHEPVGLPGDNGPAFSDLRAAALVSADFDEDGVPDLVTGYADPASGGAVSVQRGNIDALFPNSDEARARRLRSDFTSAAFFPESKNLALPEPANFLGAGDFDADGHWDIVAARSGGDKLYWLRGDGHGGFSEPKIIPLPGKVTALTIGDINRADGLTDLVLAIETQAGPRVLVYESPDGALRGTPESFSLPASSRSLAIGQLDDDRSADLAIGSGHDVLIIHGRDRKLSLDVDHKAGVKAPQIDTRTLDAEVLSVVIGDFIGDTQEEVAVLTADGQVRALAREGNEVLLATGSTSSSRLVAAKVSALPKSDLLLSGGTNAVQILTEPVASAGSTPGDEPGPAAARMTVAGSIMVDSEVTAMLPMRLNADALQDLVMASGDGSRSLIETQTAGTYVVNVDGVTNDKMAGDGECKDDNGTCSFNAALQEANAHPGADTITFNIPGGGVHTISHGFGQYADQAVTIDGTTQPGGRIEIVANGDYPIVFYGGNSVLRGVAVYGSSTAIILPSSGNIIEGNYIGFRADGSKPTGFGTGGSGISFTGGVNSSLHGGNNLIGGTTAQARNVISNCENAVYLGGALPGNVIRGNYVGTNIAGTAALPNTSGAIRGDSIPDIVVGGTVAGAGNLISGNTPSFTQSAIYVPSTPSVLIQGNLIGTTADGTQPLANSGSGINAGNGVVTIGGTTPAARNVIAACSHGIEIYSDYFFNGSDERIQGNFIGTNAAGSGALPNSGNGVQTGGAQHVTIGGTATGAGNLISGNSGHGVNIGGGTNNTNSTVVVQGNRIGTDVNGSVALPNMLNGVELGASNNSLIGGTSPEARNLISGNHENGLRLSGGAGPSHIEGNYIGVNRFGTGTLGNQQNGILQIGQAYDFIGGTGPGAGNVIAFNGRAGIGSNDTGNGLYCQILSNSIFSNTGLGIDRGNDGVTKYSVTNHGQAPVITSLSTSGSQTTITGKLKTWTNGGTTPHTIQFFSNSNPDPSGFGEGQLFIGQTTINAGSNIEVSFSATITPSVPPGRFVSAVAVGPINQNDTISVFSSEFSFCARVAGEGTPENTPLKINLVLPMLGGDNGSATVTVIGEGISQGAKVVLRRAGFADIVGQNVEVSEDGSVVSARFDLKGQPLGDWDVVVTNSDNATAIATGAYTIENGRTLVTGTAFLGHGAIRKGRPSRYTVIIQNPGNNDLYGVPLFVTGIPKNATVSLNFELTPVPRTSAMPADFDPSSIPPVIQTDSGQIIALVIPVLPGHTTQAFEIGLEIPDEGPVPIKVFSTTPLLRGPSGAGANTLAGPGSPDAPVQVELSDGSVNCLNSIFQNVFGCLSNFTPVKAGKDCAKAVLSGLGLVNNLVSIVVSTPSTGGGKVMSFSQLVGASLSTALDSGKCFGDVFPPAKILDAISCGMSAVNILNDCAPKVSQFIIDVFTAKDPNDKVGAMGSGPEHFVTGEVPLPYMILFENKPEASAAAQEVVITDQLDTSKLDLNTFQLGPISFGTNAIVTPPAGLSAWTKDVDLRPANNLVVRVIAALEKGTGIVTWRFFSLDPATMQPTTDPIAGFLPPNKNAPEGDGAVTFTVSAKPNQPTGTEIRNQASIVFDANAAISTPQWLNTIDNAPPSSQVLPFATNQNSTHIEVHWGGNDAGAGITTYTIYVSENGGPYRIWLGNTTLTSAFYDASPNSTVSFFSVARDGAGNLEAEPLSPDVTSNVTPSGQLLNISTRLRVESGERVLIGGFIITGSDAKKVLIRGIGPSLANFGVTNALGDTTLELFQGNTLLASNDNWKQDQRAEIEATTIPPTNDLESAIVRTLPPGSYTAILRGNNNLTGIGVVESYDLDPATNSKLANIASRGFVDTGDNAMIGGFIVGGNNSSSARVVVRAIGPSLSAFGIAGALADPSLELKNSNGATVASNDDWKEFQEAEITASGLAPGDERESAIVATLVSGGYTAIVRGFGGGTGVGVVEVYNIE